MMGIFAELRWLDGMAQAELVADGQISAAELLEATLVRVSELNPQLNAVVTSMFEEARGVVAKMPASSPVITPFQSVPFLLKDLGVMYAGTRLTGGSAALADFVPNIDSEITRRFKNAGFVTIGKSNTPEFGLLPTTESKFLGTCHNPWDLTRIVGGSSGGAAAAVAAGIVPIAHATDGGGSIRIPASCCGLFGLKPTRARTPQGPANGDVMGGLSIGHCVTRTVRDSAAVLDVIAGPDIGDPYVAPPPVRPFLPEVGVAPGRLKIGYITQAPNGQFIHPDCVTATEEAAHLCADLGHDVFAASPKFDAEQFEKLFIDIWAAGCAWSVLGVSQLKKSPPNPAEYEPLTWALYERGMGMSAAEYLLRVQGLQAISRQVAHFFTEVDIWLTPTVAEPPLKLGQFEQNAGNPLAALERAIAFVPFTPLANTTGMPAMSMPLFWNEANLPIGVHFMGRYGDEATLFRLASQLETAQPWAHKHPPL